MSIMTKVIIVVIVRIVVKMSRQTSNIIMGFLGFLWRYSRKK